MAISRAALLLVLLALAAPAAWAAAEGEAEGLSADCEAQLDAMWDLYRNPKYTLEDCDASCLAACYGTLEEAIYTDHLTECPRQDDITRCFGYYVPQWEEYMTACELFTVSTSEMPAGSTGEAEGEATPSSSTSTTAEGEAEAEAPATETTGEAEAEAQAPAAAPAEEGEAAAAVANATMSSDTAADEEAEAEAGRRLLAEAEAEAEGAKTTGVGVCFPSFKSTDEFNMYLRGEYFTLAYDVPSDTAGIILSVFFWVGLAGMGFYLRK